MRLLQCTCCSSLFRHGAYIRGYIHSRVTLYSRKWYPRWNFLRWKTFYCYMHYWVWSVFSSKLSSMRKHIDLKCMNWPHSTVSAPVLRTSGIQVTYGTPNYLQLDGLHFLSNCRQFCSPIVPLFQWCYACVCTCIAGFYLGFFPRERFFSTFRFLLHGVFPWSV